MLCRLELSGSQVQQEVQGDQGPSSADSSTAMHNCGTLGCHVHLLHEFDHLEQVLVVLGERNLSIRPAHSMVLLDCVFIFISQVLVKRGVYLDLDLSHPEELVDLVDTDQGDLQPTNLELLRSALFRVRPVHITGRPPVLDVATKHHNALRLLLVYHSPEVSKSFRQWCLCRNEDVRLS